MNKKIKMLWIAGATTLALTPALKAEDAKGMFVGGAVTVANDSLKQVTNKTYGMGFNVGFDQKLGDTNLGFRPSFAITLLPGNKALDGSKTSLTNLQIGTDLVIPTGYERVNVITGLSLNLWRYLASPATHGDNPWGLDGSKAPNNLKFGFRLGLDVKISSQWSAEALLQMVEFGSSTSDQGNQNFNPTWIQLGVKYHF